MSRINLRAEFLGVVVVPIAAVGSLLTACSTNAQNQAQTTNATTPPADNAQPMDHGNMNHGGMDHGNMHSMGMELGPADAEYDLRFLDAMIPHHRGAISMAKDALNKAQHPELRQLANEIIASQQTEIDQMKQWRKTWYGK